MVEGTVSWDKDATLSPETEYQALVRSLRRKHRFDFVFARCSPSEGRQIVRRSREDIPGRSIEVFQLRETTDDLFRLLVASPDRDRTDILFVTGIEEFLTDRPESQETTYPPHLQSVPLALRYLHHHREQFQNRFRGTCFVFLLPLFALKYFIRENPELFGEKCEVYEFPTELELSAESPLGMLEGEDLQQPDLDEAAREIKLASVKSALASGEHPPQRVAELLLQLGGLLAARKDYEGALVSCNCALAIDPTLLLAWYNRGVAECLWERYEEGILSYDRALTLQSDFYPALFNRGKAFNVLGRYREAMISYDLALRAKPNFYPALESKANVLADLGLYDEALGVYDAALQVQPDCYPLWLNRGATLESLHQDAAALASYDRALSLRSDDATAWSKRGRVLENLGEFERAVASYDRALFLRSRDRTTLIWRGNALAQLDRNEEALASYDRAIALDDDDLFAWYCRGNVLCQLGRNAEAIASYDKAIRIDPEHEDVWNSRKLALSRLGFV